jgi:bifunctional enzyme CysN/CysC
MNELGTSMHGQQSIPTARIDHYLKDNAHRGLLRLSTCGPVDGGVLVGRQVVDVAGQGSERLAATCSATEQADRCGRETDPVLLELVPEGSASSSTEGSGSETTAEETFFIARAASEPGAVRSMILGASDNDVALLLIPARTGLSSLARRDTCLVSDAGFRHVVLLITGMDEAGYAPETFDEVKAEVEAFAGQVGIDSVEAIPVVISTGGNIVHRAAAMPWYKGPTLVDFLATVKPDVTWQRDAPFRLLVQQVKERNGGQQDCAGLVAGGTIRAGERVRIQPMGRESRVVHISSGPHDADRAVAGQTVTLTLQGASGIGPGSVISTIDAPAEVADQFEATVVWLHEQPLYPGRKYLINIGANTVGAVVTDIKYEVNVDTLEHLAANTLTLNGIAECNLALDRPIPFAPYETNRDLGGFSLIDRLSNETMGVGLIHFALRRAHNIHLQHVDIDKRARVAHKGHRPCVLWFTGLSGSGKSTVANLVERRLHALGAHTYLLDGDNVRHGLSRDLGFTDADRVENIRRVAEVSKLMVDAGLIVITAFISPFRAERRMARQLLDEGEFFEIFTDTPLEIAEQRDPKGLYKKARRGDLKNFTGIDSPYERPEAPEIRLDTGSLDPEEAADMVIQRLTETGILCLVGEPVFPQ